MTTIPASRLRPVLPFTRAALVLSALLAIIAGVQLYVLTDHTEEWFAWTIAAPMSAAFLGASYWSGALLLLLAVRERACAHIRIAMAAVAAFVPLMCVATWLHFDRFHMHSAAFTARLAAWAWLVVYVAVPFILLAALLMQRRAGGGDPPRGAPLEPALRLLLLANAAIATLIAVALFLQPMPLAPYWPWPLTPLTGRVIGSGFLALAAGSFQFLHENDWSRGRVGTIPYALLGLLQLAALARYPGSMSWERPGAALYVAFMVSVLVGGLYATAIAWRHPVAPPRVAA